MRKLIPFAILFFSFKPGQAYESHYEINNNTPISRSLLVFSYSSNSNPELRHYCAEGHTCEEEEPFIEETEDTVTITPEMLEAFTILVDECQNISPLL